MSLRDLARDAYRWLYFNPNLRYPRPVQLLRGLFSLSPREVFLNDAMQYIASTRMEGDYLEFGVYEGNTFVAAYHLARQYHLGMRFFAFDSFQGLPIIEGVDAQGFKQFQEKDFACDLEQFRGILRKRSVDESKVVLVSGFYNESLKPSNEPAARVKKAAFAYVDCDLYSSTVDVLDFLTGIVQDGTLLAFDDWFHFRGNPERGEQRAFREWLERNPRITASEFHKFDWSGNSFILHMVGDVSA